MLNFLGKISGLSRYLIISFCACLLSLSPVGAQTNAPFYWDSIDVDIALQPNGDLLITETQTYTFTDDHTNQRYRYIPLDRIDQITDVAVYEDEERMPVQTGTENGQYWIRWQHDLNPPESHEFAIEYRVIGGVRIQGDTNKLYWRALFAERNADIKRSRITVRLPEALAGKVTRFSSHGGASSDRQIAPTTFEFTVDGPLPPQQFLDVEVSFPRNTLNLASSQWQSTTGRMQRFLSSKFAEYVLAVGILVFPISIRFCIATLQKRCPKCGKFTLRRMSRVLKYATEKHQGSKEIKHICESCSYHRTFTQIIPVISNTSDRDDRDDSYRHSSFSNSGGGDSSGSSNDGASGGGGGG